MLRALISLVAALGLASSASAATIIVDSDKATYLSGETITITTTLTTTGLEPISGFALLELVWSDAQVAGTPGPAQYPTAITSGFFTWSVGAGNCLATSCLVLDQLGPVGPCCVYVPDPAVIISTLTMVADAIGLLNFSFGATIVFGATPTFGANAAVAQIVPEPGTAALLGLALVGLATARRRPMSLRG